MNPSLVWLFVCLLAAALGGDPVLGVQEVPGGAPEVVVVREEGLDVQAGQIEHMVPGIRSNLEKTLGWKLARPPRVVLTADRERFEQMTGNPLISAFALPRHQTIVMLLSPTTATAVMHETLEHELCHLVLHDHISREQLPKWLDEGICQWVSGSLGEIFAGQGLVTAGINLARRPIPLEQLTESFPSEKRLLIQAYEESRLFVEFLVAGYGKDGLLRLLAHLRKGEDIDAAALRVFSRSLESLEQEWLRELRNRNLWLLWLSQYLYEILFFLAALLTVVAAVRLMIRKRAYPPDDEAEEE